MDGYTILLISFLTSALLAGIVAGDGYRQGLKDKFHGEKTIPYWRSIIVVSLVILILGTAIFYGLVSLFVFHTIAALIILGGLVFFALVFFVASGKAKTFLKPKAATSTR